MPQHSFSVLVVPGQWDGTGDALAERLVSVTRQPTGRLADALRRGPVTLEADLHREEAERLLEQLERLDVPAEIRDESDEGVVGATSAAADGEEAAEESLGDGEASDDAWGEFAELEESLEAVVESAELDAPDEEFDDLESVDESAEPEETSDDGLEGPEDVASVDGWEAVLGRSDGGGEADDGSRVREQDDVGNVSDDGGASADAESTGGDAGVPAPSDVSGEVAEDVAGVDVPGSESAATKAPGGTAEVADDGGRGLQNIEEAGEAETPALEELSDDGTAGREVGGSDPSQNVGDDETPPLDPPGDESEGSLSIASDPGGSGDGGAMEPGAFGAADTGLDDTVPSTDESEFDGAAMTEALTDSGQSSTFDDGTFDDRPEHIPALAAVLSLVAPGAGQIYNGESDKAWEVATRAILVVPWVRAVRDALERARAIRDNEAPKPPEGSFVSALKHGAVIYSALVAFGVGAYLVVQVASNQMDSGETADPDIPAVDIESVFREAELAVHGARIDAWKRTGEKRVSDDERFTMSDEARAARLFAIGYRHCRAHDHRMCESAMRKVARLDSPYRRRAYRLQAWASVQQDPNEPNSKMPDVEISEGLLEGNEGNLDSEDAGRDDGGGDEPAPDVEGESTGTTLSPDRDDDSLPEDLKR